MKCPVDRNCPRCYYSLKNYGLRGLAGFVFGHRTMKISRPVCSAVNKHRMDWLVSYYSGRPCGNPSC